MGWRQGSRALLQVIISKLFQQVGAGGVVQVGKTNYQSFSYDPMFQYVVDSGSA